MITLRAVSVRLKKEGIQHMTDFEDMSNAFAQSRGAGGIDQRDGSTDVF